MSLAALPVGRGLVAGSGMALLYSVRDDPRGVAARVQWRPRFADRSLAPARRAVRSHRNVVASSRLAQTYPAADSTHTSTMGNTMPCYDVFLGIDVGKYFHYAYAMDACGNKLFATVTAQTNQALRRLFQRARHYGRVLAVVDQPNNIGKLVVTIARDMQIDIAYLPGLAMRNLARTYTGNCTTDKRDAYIIADAARTRPDALRPVDRDHEIFTQLKYLNGLDNDLRRHYTTHVNQLRSTLLSCYPELECALRGQKLHFTWVLSLLAHYQNPERLRRVEPSRLASFARRRGARSPESLIGAMCQSIRQPSVAMGATDQLSLGIGLHANYMLRLAEDRQAILAHVDALCGQLPHTEILLSIPGIGIRTAARILMCVGDLSAFATPAHLASYAGICPQQRLSGVSINSSGPNRGVSSRKCVPMWPLLLARGHKNTNNNAAGVIIGLPMVNTRTTRPPVVSGLLVYFPR